MRDGGGARRNGACHQVGRREGRAEEARQAEEARRNGWQRPGGDAHHEQTSEVLGKARVGAQPQQPQGRVVGAVAQLGAAGLALGLKARLVQVGVIVTVQLILYDTLKHAFGVP